MAALSSLQSSNEQSLVLGDLATKQIRLLYVSPERSRSGAFRNVLSRIRLARFVVDEAHCISEWGHDFRPDYLQLNSIVESLGKPPLMAVTATATERVRESIIRNLGMQKPQTFIGGFNRPNLHYSVHRCKSDPHKLEMLDKALPKLCVKGGSGLIYATTRKQCEEVAKVAAKAFFHGYTNRIRQRLLIEFIQRVGADNQSHGTILLPPGQYFLSENRNQILAITHRHEIFGFV